MNNIILALYVLTTSLGLVILKLGTSDGLPIRMVQSRLHFSINLYTVLGILLYGISFILYMYLISKNDLGYIIPVTASFVYIIIFVASYFIFNEVFTLIKIIGIAFIILGLAFLNASK